MKMGLTDNLFVNNFLNFGQFDLFSPQNSWKKRRASINRLIRLIAFFNAVKFIFINLAAFVGFPELKLYLIELYMFDGDYQKLVDVGLGIAFIGFYAGFTYWCTLDEKLSSLESFRFLLVPDTKDLHRYRQRYHLNQQSIDKFVKFYRLVCLCLRLFVTGYFIFSLGTVLRCLYESFYFVSFSYFLSVGLFLGLITLVAWLLFFLFLIPKFILVLLSTEFLVLRVKALDTLIFSRFLKTKLTTISNPIKFRKQKADKVLRRLNDFCRQFKEINSVLDSSLSGIMLGIYICLLVIPFFLIFVEITLEMRLLVCVLIQADYLFCSSFFFCNDRLGRQVGLFVNNQWSLTNS